MDLGTTKLASAGEDPIDCPPCSSNVPARGRGDSRARLCNSVKTLNAEHSSILECHYVCGLKENLQRKSYATISLFLSFTDSSIYGAHGRIRPAAICRQVRRYPLVNTIEQYVSDMYRHESEPIIKFM